MREGGAGAGEEPLSQRKRRTYVLVSGKLRHQIQNLDINSYRRVFPLDSFHFFSRNFFKYWRRTLLVSYKIMENARTVLACCKVEYRDRLESQLTTCFFCFFFFIKSARFSCVTVFFFALQ